MDKIEIAVMCIAAALSLGIALMVIIQLEKREKQSQKSLFATKKTKSNFTQLVRRVMRNPYMPIVASIYRRFEECSRDSRIAGEQTVKVISLLLGLDTVVAAIVMLTNTFYFGMITAALLIYCINISLIYLCARKAKADCYEWVDALLSDVKHYFYIGKDIEKALWQSAEKVNPEISALARRICDIVGSVRREEMRKEYDESEKDPYLRLFVEICVSTAEHGDSLNEKKESAFVENINIIKRELRRKIETIKRTDFIFSGLSFVAVLPICAIEPVKRWAIDALPELVNFYEGQAGVYVTAASILLSFAAFRVLIYMRGLGENEKSDTVFVNRIKKNALLTNLTVLYTRKYERKASKYATLLAKMGIPGGLGIFLAKRILLAVAGLAIGLCIAVVAHSSNKRLIIASEYDLYKVIPMTGQRIITQEEFVALVNRYRGSSGANLCEHLRSMGFTHEETLASIEKQFDDQSASAKNEYFKWYELLFVIGFAGCCFGFPATEVYFRKQLFDGEMEEEVMSFRVIIAMHTDMKGISLFELLTAIESFAVIFRVSLQKCINNLSRNEKQALEQLKTDEDFAPFSKIVDCFLLTDELPVRQAFDEVTDDIKYYEQVNERKSQILIKRKGDIAELIAFLPGAFILCFCLIVPFAIAGAAMFTTSFVGNINDIIQ